MERCACHPETTSPEWCTSIKGFHTLVQRTRRRKPGPHPPQKASARGPPAQPSTPASVGAAQLPSPAPSALDIAARSPMQPGDGTQRRLSLSFSPGARRPAQEVPPLKKPWRSQSEGTPSATSSSSKRRLLDDPANARPSPAPQHKRRRTSGSAMGPWVVSTGGPSPTTFSQPSGLGRAALNGA